MRTSPIVSADNFRPFLGEFGETGEGNSKVAPALGVGRPSNSWDGSVKELGLADRRSDVMVFSRIRKRAGWRLRVAERKGAPAEESELSSSSLLGGVGDGVFLRMNGGIVTGASSAASLASLRTTEPLWRSAFEIRTAWLSDMEVVGVFGGGEYGRVLGESGLGNLPGPNGLELSYPFVVPSSGMLEPLSDEAAEEVDNVRELIILEAGATGETLPRLSGTILLRLVSESQSRLSVLFRDLVLKSLKSVGDMEDAEDIESRCIGDLRGSSAH